MSGGTSGPDGGAPSPDEPGPVTVLVSAQGAMAAIAVDATQAYWTNPGTEVGIGNGSIGAVPLAGGAASIFASKQNYPGAIAAGPSTAFTGVQRDRRRHGRRGGRRDLDHREGSVMNLASVAVDAANVYWTTAGDAGGNGTVSVAPIGGGATTVLATEQSSPGPIAVSGSNVCWVSRGSGAGGSPSGAISCSPVTAANVTIVAMAQAGPVGVAVDATQVYWATSGTAAMMYDDSAVLKAPVGGGTTTVLAPAGKGPAGLVSDGTYVYWTAGTDGTVSKVAYGRRPGHHARARSVAAWSDRRRRELGLLGRRRNDLQDRQVARRYSPDVPVHHTGVGPS